MQLSHTINVADCNKNKDRNGRKSWKTDGKHAHNTMTKSSTVSCDWIASLTHRIQQCSTSRALGWGWTPCRPTRRCEKPQCPSRSRMSAKRSGDLLLPTRTHSHLQHWPGRQWRRRAGREREEKLVNPGGWRRTGPWNACHSERNRSLYQRYVWIPACCYFSKWKPR